MSARKRHKEIENGEKPRTQNYLEGSIVRIRLENILTYESVEFTAGPYLNVIIGPNGTGKSTIVCAICLGLAGKTTWLGRAHQPSEFIKFGATKGIIELELHNPVGENYVIRREISRNNTSHWLVNGRNAMQKTVEEMATHLNIQVGNLCQFLPQEKVADFSKMTQQELLENTEKAVGSELYDYHQKLKEARLDARRLEKSYDNSKLHLEQEKLKNARLEQDVKQYEERQRHLEKVKILQMKRPWVEYEEKRRQYQREKDEKDRKVEEVKRARLDFSPLQKKLDDAQAKVESIDAMMKKEGAAIREYATHAHASSKEIEEEIDKMNETLDDLKYKRQEEDSRKKRVHDLKHQLQNLENELQSLPQTADYQPAFDKNNQEIRQVNQEMTHVQHQGERISVEIKNVRTHYNNFQKELQHLHNIVNRRLETLQAKHRDTYRAVKWLRENEDKFKAKIFEPIMLLINVKNPSDAKYVEMHIAFNDMKAFVCEDPDDMELFLQTMRDEQKLKVNVVKMPSEPVLSFQPKRPIGYYEKYGFRCYLQNLFDCPEPVMRYLCLQYRVHLIPVGTQYTKDNVQKVIRENSELVVFYTHNHQYNIKKSKYGDREVSARNTKLKEASILTVSIDSRKEKYLQQQIQECQKHQQMKEEEYKSLQRRSVKLEEQMNNLRVKKKELMQMKDQKKRLLSEIQGKKDRILRTESEATNLRAEEERAKQTIHQINLRKINLLQKLKDYTQKCFDMSKEKVQLSLRHASAIRQKVLVEEDFRNSSQELQAIERHFEEIKEKLKQTKDIARRLLDAAKRATNTGANDELSSELKKAFEQYPSTLEDIDEAIHEQQARADCTFQTDERIVREYHQRKKEIMELQENIDEKIHELEMHQGDIESAKQHWLGPLKQFIRQINDNFSYFFETLKCAGEVDLNIPENTEDYEKYGVRIKVKFRDTEQLRELSPHHQSGGERSVATVLYMMALQELAKCPFRCVDEINQGMDPVNERKVFDLVVHTVCKKQTSQYFLLTPKLLPDLKYDDNMTVLCIYNGPEMISHKDWKIRKFLKRRAKLAE